MTDSKPVRLGLRVIGKLESKMKEKNCKTLDEVIEVILQENDSKTEVSSECDQYHITEDNFKILNQLMNRELTVIDGQDKEELLNTKLQELIEKAIQKKQHPDKWPDYPCPNGKGEFLKKLDDLSGQCLKDTPEKRYSITASDCWACLKRRKQQRQREGKLTIPEYIDKKLETPTCGKLIEGNRCSIDNRICNPTDCAQYYWSKKGERP